MMPQASGLGHAFFPAERGSAIKKRPADDDNRRVEMRK